MDGIEQIRSALTNEINPAPLSELDENQLASVLIIIYGKEPIILMTEKAKTLKVHGGEISFPGGKMCEKDKDLLETAIRETEEELDLHISRKQVIGQLDPVITLNSKYMITPFVKTMADDTHPEHRSIKEMYTFTFEKYHVWGASARMLRQIFISLSKKNLLN